MSSCEGDEKAKIEILAQKKIAFVTSKPPILTSFKSVTSKLPVASDETKHKVSKDKKLDTAAQRMVREFINIDNRIVEYYTGTNVRYYKEYKSFHVPKSDSLVSFPLENCDPLPLEKAGDLRFFFTSSVAGSQATGGAAVRIIDPNITKIIVIRGKSESNGHWAQVYIGIDPNDFKLMGYRNSKKIYNAKILVIQSKDTAHVETRCYYPPKNPIHGYAFSSESPAYACNLDSTTMALEVKKHLLDPKDFNWNGETFQKILAELFMKSPDVHLQHGCLTMQTCYWDTEENKLKGTKYRH